MNSVETLVVGAGHAGLAVSNLLSAAGHEHVVVERGRVGERWRTERWDSLRLLTPNWMTRLPGLQERPWPLEDYMNAAEFAGLLNRYATAFDAPVIEKTSIVEVTRAASGSSYSVVTDRGCWATRNLVVATGPHGRPSVPPALRGWSRGSVNVIPSRQYRNPTQLPTGGVLVVGASSSGVQIADELAHAGRTVVLAVGRHSRLPRRYRGMDIYWWLETTGRLAKTIDDMPDPVAARREPSLQLVGRNQPGPSAQDLDLATLRAVGVRLTGRLERLDAGTAWFRDDLRQTVAAADRQMHRLLDAVDDHVRSAGLGREVLDPVRPRPIDVSAAPTSLNLAAERISTIVLATGYRAHHPWLRVPVLASDGTIEQRRGVTAAPGLYVVGQRFQHRRDSGLIDGARHDAAAVTAHLLGRTSRKAPAA